MKHEAAFVAAVVGFPHELKGEGIFCYCILVGGVESSELVKALQQQVPSIGPLPSLIRSSSYLLPKTRSGKSCARILRKVAAGERGAARRCVHTR